MKKQKYKFHDYEFVKLTNSHSHKNRTFKIVERKRIANNGINAYYIETIDDNLDLGLWSIRFLEYQSKIRNLTDEEQNDVDIMLDANKYNI